MKLHITICLIFFNLALFHNATCFVVNPDTLVKTRENEHENYQNRTYNLNASLAILNGLLNEETNDQDTSRSKELVSKAHSLFNKVKSESRVVEFLDFSRTQTLPLAINRNISGLDYMIVFDSITLTPSGGLITSYMSLEVPQNGKRLAFRGGNIKFNKSGISANARLDLIEDFPIKIGEKTLLNLKADQRKTYVNFDCKGFTDLGVQAELEFSRDLIIPENADGSLLAAPSRVKGTFEVVQMREWGEILAKINLPAFQVNGLTGFGFKVTDAIFDFSETANASGIKFPQDYGIVDPLWQGVYIRHASVSLPIQFKSTERKRLEFFTHDLLIDDIGISGIIGAKNILLLDKGDMDSWRFSIDSLYIGLSKNQLVGGGLGGVMQVPLLGEDPLKYAAAINVGGNYLFSVTTTGTKKIPLWAAEAQIDQGSLVEIRVIEDRFLPKISLNGKLSVGGDSKSEAKLADITFEQLQLQTIAPFIKVGSIKLGSEKAQQKMNNFPVTLKNIGVISKDNDIGLNLEAIVNFVGEGDAGFGGNGTFTVWGEQKRANGRQQLKFKNIQINEIAIDINGGAFKLKGLLTVYKEHSVYGKGFKGAIEATFTPGLQVSATAQFGTVNNYRYWYADALVTLPNGIVVAPGFGLYGFGGGAYYHMKRQVSKPVALPSNENSNPSLESLEAGKSVTGIVYIPDQSTALGIKATVVVGTFPTPQPFNGDATFEVAFNENSGVDFISFLGNAYFMTAIDKRSSNTPVYANQKIDFDVKNSSLFGNLAVFVNVAGGMVKGIGVDNSAGSATLYFSPQDWFIHIGTPEKRIGLKMMYIFEAQSYMMVGTQMPGMPDVPDNVKHILKSDMQFMRDENALRSGGGFAFGSSLHMSTGDLSFLVFYARLDAGAGFDMMLKN